MSVDRCRYTSPASDNARQGRVSCWRPVYQDGDRCVWHADDAGKSVVDLASYDPDPGERLDGAFLRGLSLAGVDWLAGVVLVGADLANADLSRADLSGADLQRSTLRQATARDACFERANLEDATLSRADLRGADLALARLDETDFSDCRINGETTFGDRVVYEIEIVEGETNAPEADVLEAAIRTYRCLERVSQDNTLYAQASRFYRESKDLRRRFNWERGNVVRAGLAEASRAFTGYGNRPWRVIGTSVGLIVLAGLLYPFVGGLRQIVPDSSVLYALSVPPEVSLEFLAVVLAKSVYFSVVTFTTLGYGNIEPASTAGQYLAGAEALLGSILMALLVVVLTRSAWLR